MFISRAEADGYVALSPLPKRNRDRLTEGFENISGAISLSPTHKKVKLDFSDSSEYLDLAILDKLGVTESVVSAK